MLCKAVHYTKQGELSVDAIRESSLFYRCFAGRVLFAMQGQPGGDTAQGRARPEISFIFFFKFRFVKISLRLGGISFGSEP